MEWMVVAAITALVVAMVLVVRDASPRERR